MCSFDMPTRLPLNAGDMAAGDDGFLDLSRRAYYVLLTRGYAAGNCLGYHGGSVPYRIGESVLVSTAQPRFLEHVSPNPAYTAPPPRMQVPSEPLDTSACGSEAACVLAPVGCEGDECQFLARWTIEGDVVKMTLETLPVPTTVALDDNIYVSVGWSLTPSMKEAVIYGCIHDPDRAIPDFVQGVYAKWYKGPKPRVR